MKKQIAISVLCAGLLSSIAPIAGAAEDAEAQCRQDAKDEGIPADEMQGYIAECLEAMGAEGDAAEPADEAKNNAD